MNRPSVISGQSRNLSLPPGLDALDVALGLPLGPAGPPVAARAVGPSPHDALVAALLPALRRPPCVVAFSGGRDSTLLLAVALEAARREGLPEPIPVTLRFPALDETDETDWQGRALAALRPADHVVLEPGDGLQVLGDAWRELARRVGPFAPANASFALPFAPHAAGGSLVLGVGGDELLGRWRWSAVADAAARRAPRTPRLALSAAFSHAPLAFRRARHRPSLGPPPWIATPSRRAALRRLKLDGAQPRRFDDHVRREARLRAASDQVPTYTRVLAPHDVRFHAPLLDAGVVTALARAGGANGFGGRAAATAALAGPAGVPDALLQRPTKATFWGVYVGEPWRAFARDWDGQTFDPDLVDADILRATWLQPSRPDFRSALLLATAWWATQGADA